MLKDYIDKHINKNKKIITVIILIILFFWWFYIRPNQIRSQCSKIAQNQAVATFKKRMETLPPQLRVTNENFSKKGLFLPSDYEFWYKMCLRNYGLRK